MTNLIKDNIVYTINKKLENKRSDLIIKKIIKNLSRNKIKKIIKKKLVFLNNKILKKPSKKLKKNDILYILIKIKKKKKYIPQKIPLNIVFEDKYILIINKKSNIIVHPGSGNKDKTILNSILFYYPNINKKIPRCGIIHRLDKNTTGLIIIAKKLNIYNYLINLLKKRKIKRNYITLVFGKIFKKGKIKNLISRDKKKRIKMTVSKKGKKAITYFNVIENFKFCTLLNVQLKTGRTHQIRVHMNFIKHPIIGEKIYINKNIKKLDIPFKLLNKFKNFKRQALHAYKLKFIHPIYKNIIEINCPIPKDMLNLIFYLRNNN